MVKKMVSAKSDKGFIYNLEAFISKYKLPIGIIGIAILLVAPHLGFSQYIMNILIKIGIYIMLGLGLNILTGYTGLVSLGHAGFVAIGAYTASIIAIKSGMNFIPAAILGGLMAAFFGLLLGLPTLRLTGTYLSIVTLGFGEIVRTVLMNWDSVTNGTLGVKNIPKPEIFGIKLTLANNGLYYMMLILVALTTIFCIVLINSKTGRAFLAIKTDEMAGIMMGINVTYYKVLAFVLSAFISAVAGAFYATLIGYVDPNSFTFDISTLILSIVILGGMGTIRGMYVGAVVLISFPEVSRKLMDYRFVVYGLILVFMMRFRPQGLLGWKSQMPYKLSKNVKKRLQDLENSPS
ncbi:branched-chain amino acid ABC transporter permease [Anaerocolumna sp.]|uniref:branched-chain amino acid ABC transporter permease n=1 Tax=Anaerocolumna sp. TaxID=2041569 RepID=UPI0028B1CA34|nr:branched-chain amino acid ABC transporter permease [Anaerocolumna sp.]